MASGDSDYAAAAKATSPSREWALIVTLCAAQVLEVMGVTVVVVALPAIGDDLDLSDAQLQLVVSLYAVLYGGLLLTAGRAADLRDRRSVFAAGMAVTLTGTVLCAVAGSGGMLLAGRAVQGVGAALVTPAALSLLTSNFAAGPRRRTAVSAWTAAAAGGGAAGFVVGGVVVGSIGWRGVFWLLTPIAVLVLATMWWVVRSSPPSTVARGLDLPGSVTVSAGLVLLVWGAGLVADPAAAPIPPVVVVTGGCCLLIAFIGIERRGRAPLIGWSELTHEGFLIANGVAFLNTATTSAAGALITLIAQRTLGLDAWQTGLLLLPFSLSVIAGSATGSWWLRRTPTVGMSAGLATVAVAMVALAVATAARSVAGLATAVVVAGLGLSWAAVTSTHAATAALPKPRQGVASGAVNTAAQIGTALGVATLLSLAAAVGVGVGRDGSVTGYVVAFLAGAAAAAACALLILWRALTRTGQAR